MVQIQKIEQDKVILDTLSKQLIRMQGFYTWIDCKLCLITSEARRVLVDKKSTELDFVVVPLLATYNYKSTKIEYISIQSLSNSVMIAITKHLLTTYTSTKLQGGINND